VSILWLACRVAMNLWDDQSFVAITGRLVAAARATGAIQELPGAFGMAATASLLTGDLTAAAAYIEQLDAGLAVTGSVPALHGRLALAAWQGRADPGAVRAPDDRPGADRAAGLGVSAYTRALPELAEAAARSGDMVLAGQAVALLERTTLPSGTEWALGMRARSRALIRDGEQAEELYTEAVTRLGRTRVVPHLARAHLLYGEWLRRCKRRIDARTQLRTANEMFAAMGADGFSRRAERELAATGERIRRRDVRPVVELTAQETQIARLVADGRSNPEIAAELFISPRTVEYHLHKIFSKLDITARGQLARALATR
jgi:DNA-binding CsgD family transcriptional regulator